VKLDELAQRLTCWLEPAEGQDEAILSSRVRLARNLADIQFPHRADGLQRSRVYENVLQACRSTSSLGEDALAWNLDELPDLDRRLLVERHLVSTGLAGEMGGRGVIVNAAESLGVMLNEEDHVRIQSVTPGLDLDKALERAIALDRELEEKLAFAVHDDWGYLTACPTNVGTGLRVSVLIHLPALVLAGQVKKVHRAVGELGMAVRGWYGEGSGALGDFYQLSNQRTLGRTEEESCGQLRKVTARVLKLESDAREGLQKSETRRRRLLDRVHRSWGILRSARLLTVEQVMACTSDVRLGRSFGLFPRATPALLNRLALFSQPAHLEKREGRKLVDDEMSWARAEWVRGELAEAGD
jgi:protein arginine kinase